MRSAAFRSNHVARYTSAGPMLRRAPAPDADSPADPILSDPCPWLLADLVRGSTLTSDHIGMSTETTTVCPSRPTPTRRIPPSWLSCLAACLVAGPVAAQPVIEAGASRRSRSAVVTATPMPIAVDGVLDEPIWGTAPGIGDLVQRQPHEGATPTERTRRRAALRRGPPVHRRARTRRRTGARHRHADGARRQHHGRRSHRDSPRHLPRSAQRLLLRHQSRRARSSTA